MYCPNCKETDHEAEAKFCHVCGHQLNHIHIVINEKTPNASRYEYANSFHEGLAMVTTGGKNGFIDKKGLLVIEPKFDIANSFIIYNLVGRHIENFNGFYEGLAVVRGGQNGEYGCIDHSGKYVIQPQFDYLNRFSEGLAIFKSGEKYGVIDKTGRIVIQPKYYHINNFSEGLAVAQTEPLGKNIYIGKNGTLLLEKTSNMLFNWDEGFPVRKSDFNWARDFHEGLAKVECHAKDGFIDKNGYFKKPKFKYRSLNNFSENLAVFVTGDFDRCGYIDKNLKVVIEPRFEDAGDFRNGRAIVRISQKVGFIDKTGNLSIPCQFDKAYPFSEGMAAVKINEKIGFIDINGNMLIQPRFKEAQPFSEGLAAVNEDGSWGFIDKTGTYAF